MQTFATPLATSLFCNVRSLDREAVCLMVQGNGPLISFGENRTSQVQYRISLKADDQTIILESADQKPFALLMDSYGPKGTPRLVLYTEEAVKPILEYDRSDDDTIMLCGSILILAHEERGPGSAIIHAVFDGERGASLLIDGAEALQHHLTLCTSLIEGES